MNLAVAGVFVAFVAIFVIAFVAFIAFMGLKWAVAGWPEVNG
jgi:hypothetical protein